MNLSGKNKILIILGMHRSGTSLITNWLQNCGLEIGSSLLGAGLGNDKGHFEDIDFYNLHVEILRDNNLHDSGILYNPDMVIHPAHKEKIQSLVKSKNNLFDQWGWKEPRTCLFLDVYHETLPDAYYIIVFRDYQFVVVSLLKRAFAEIDSLRKTGKSYLSKIVWEKIKRNHAFKKFCHQHADDFLKVWIYYNEEILRNLKKLSPQKFLLLNYDMLNEKDYDIASFLITNWQFSLHYSKFSEVFNQNLFSKPFDIEVYIKDKQSISHANHLTKGLMAYVKD